MASNENGGHQQPGPKDTDANEPEFLDANEREQLLSDKKEETGGKHERNVSWDPQADASFEKEDPLKTPASDSPKLGRKLWKGINLKEVIALSPVEEEAETYIQKAIEETDPTKTSKSEAEMALLAAIPEDAGPAFDGDDDQDATEATIENYRAHQRKHTAATLAELGAELQENHMVQPSLGGTLRPGDITSNADDFARAATTLMRRNKAGGRASVSKQQDDAAPAVQRASDHFKRLSQQSHGSAGPGSSKKSDDLSPETTDAGDSPGTKEGEDLEAGDVSEPLRASSTSPSNRKTRREARREKVHYQLHDLDEFLKYRRKNALWYLRSFMLYLILPATFVAALLFYVFDNPPCGTATQCLLKEAAQQNLEATVTIITEASTQANATNATQPPAPSRIFGFIDRDNVGTASVSWWLLFVFVRQVITLGSAMMAETMIIDYFCLRKTWSTRLFGPFLTLLVVQAKGWPFKLFAWGINDFCFLYGDTRFARHWMFWQELIDLFNVSNPAGTITESPVYLRVLIIAVGVSFVVALKRFWLGLSLGRRTFTRYAPELAQVMRNNLLIGKVAALAWSMEKMYGRAQGMETEMPDAVPEAFAYDHLFTSSSTIGRDRSDSDATGPSMVKPELDDIVDLTGSQKIKLEQLLGAFEEPTTVEQKNEQVKIADIIQFRQSLSFLNTPFPFSTSFGPADTRQNCIESSEKVYKRLLLNRPGSHLLKFDTLALVAVRNDGTLDESKLAELVKLFRPDRQGNLSILDWAKSVDTCYKDLRLLRASIANSSRVDKAFEKIVNIFFWFIVICVVLAILGIDPFVLFASISGFILGFSFMIGAAASKYFEGLLMVLVRKPYDIGDRIAVSAVDNDTPTSGSTSWFVRDVTLYATTVCLGATNEVATYSNGSLAPMRIINAARSPQAVLFLLLKFPISTSYEKLKVYRACLEKFVTARPREWLSFNAFRATRVEADLGYVEYIAVAQHRESWQNMGALLSSKADLNSFALELSNKMHMVYKSPSLPVDLNVRQGPDDLDLAAMMRQVPSGDGGSEASPGHRRDESYDISAISAMFDKKK